MGCVIGAKTKYEYQAVTEACVQGAGIGAMIGSSILFGESNNCVKELAATAAGVKLLPYLKVVGAARSLVLVGQSLETMATMNGALIRCKGSEGTTQQALYGSLGDTRTFYFK